MVYKAVYTKKALKSLKNIPKTTSKRITEKIKFYRLQRDPLSYAKKLKDSKFGEYRYRIGNYRTFFDCDKRGKIKILLILEVKHRRESYRY